MPTPKEVEVKTYQITELEVEDKLKEGLAKMMLKY